VTALPALPPAPLLKENQAPRDFIPALGNGPLKEADARRTAAERDQEPSGADGKSSSFDKIFREKKAERDSSEKGKTEKAEGGTGEKPAANKDGTARAARSPEKPDASSLKGKKAPTVKDILSGLIDKNHAEKNQKPKEKTKPETEKSGKNARLEALLAGVRLLAVREKNVKPAKTEGAVGELKKAFSRTGEEKARRLVVIVDLRSRAPVDQPAVKSKTAAHSRKAGIERAVAKSGTHDTKKSSDSKDSFEMKVWHKPDMTQDRAEPGPRATGPEAARPRSDFSTRLADVMKNEMVKHTGLILKDGGGGEIHLVLKPESLGSVRVRLNLDDNHIVGKIIVDNNTVKQIMEENLGHLETALQQNGYQAAAFDVSVAGERRNAPEEEAFSDLFEGERESDASPAGSYEAGGASIYADSIVNIVL